VEDLTHNIIKYFLQKNTFTGQMQGQNVITFLSLLYWMFGIM